MTAQQIEGFLDKHKDLFGPGLSECSVIDYTDVPELIKRLFDSDEFKAYLLEIFRAYSGHTIRKLIDAQVSKPQNEIYDTY